jgi:hypothetical protein
VGLPFYHFSAKSYAINKYSDSEIWNQSKTLLKRWGPVKQVALIEISFNRGSNKIKIRIFRAAENLLNN